MTKKLVAGYDGSPNSYNAVMWAAREAVLLGVGLTIVTSYQDVIAATAAGYAYAGVEIGDAAAHAESDLEELVRTLRAAHPALRVTPSISAGPAAGVLAEAGGDDGIVVVGGSHRHGVMKQLLGDTARAAVRRSACPVVVINGTAADSRPVRIVVGVDESDHARAALLWAADEADLQGVPLTVLHAWTYPYGDTIDHAQARDLMRVDAARTLDAAVESARERCGQSVSGELVEGSASRGVLAALHDGDLLVLGSRGRSAVGAAMFGSTVNRVLDEASVPVAVIHS